jgi:sec-independent protein translocase protein TatA
MDIGIPELLIILVIIIILFGPSRLAKTMGELGGGLKAFKDGLSGPSEEQPKKDDKSLPTM